MRNGYDTFGYMTPDRPSNNFGEWEFAKELVENIKAALSAPGDTASLARTIEQAKSVLDIAVNAVDRLRDERDRTRKSAEDAFRDARAKKEERDALESQIETAKADHRRAVQQLQLTHKSELNTAQGETQRLRKTEGDLTERITSLQKELDMLQTPREAVQRLQDEITHLRKSLIHHEIELDEARRNASAMVEECVRKQKEMESLTQQRNDAFALVGKPIPKPTKPRRKGRTTTRRRQ